MPKIRPPNGSAKKVVDLKTHAAAELKRLADRAGVRVTTSTLGRARHKPRSRDELAQDMRGPFRWPAHPPGVVPKTVMAQDQSIFDSQGGGIFQWASEFNSSSVASSIAEGLAFLGYPWLSAAAQRPEYRVMSETIATEMTRKWIRLEAAGDVDKTERITQLNEELERLNVRDHFRCAAEQDGFFGRSHIYIDTGADLEDRDELATPIGLGNDAVSKAKVKKGSLRALRNVEAVWCYPTDYNSNNPLRDDWYKPTQWWCMSQPVHFTRLLTFIGREVPDLLKPAYSFGGLSISQMAKPYIDNWLRTRQSVADLIHSFSVFVLSTNLAVGLQADGDQLFNRVDLFNLMRDNRNLMVTDSSTEEKLENISAPLGTLDALQAQTQEHMASVSRIPLVKLTGITPQGLNASSEGEIRVFYDTIAAYQERFFRPHLKTILNFCMLNIWGEVDEDIKFAFEPLWSLDEKGQADLRKTEAETGQILVDTGIISQEEERTRIAKDPSTSYAGLDPTDVPELLEEEEEGLAPKGGGGAVKAILGGGGEPGEEGHGRGEAADSVIPFSDQPSNDTNAPIGGANAISHPAPAATRRGERAARTGITGGGPTEIGTHDLHHTGAHGGLDAGEWHEGDHPREAGGQFTSGGGSTGAPQPSVAPRPGSTAAGGRQSLRMPQYGLTPMPREAHQPEDPETEYFKKNWMKSGSVGGHAQPTPEQVEAYTQAYLGQGAPSPGAVQHESVGKPLDPKGLKRVGKQLGSNPGGVFEDKDGKRYYVKQAKSPAHGRNEVLAGALFGLAGAPTLTYRPVPGNTAVATEWETAEKNNAKDFTPEELAAAREDFAIQAWLANWDAAGLDYDNQSIINGRPVTNDLGGALEFRAQGAPKGAAFGTSVGEWDTLRDKRMNPQNAWLYGGMTPADLKRSAGKVAGISDKAIRDTVKQTGGDDKLADKLIARKRDIAKRAGIMAQDDGLEQHTVEPLEIADDVFWAADAEWNPADHPQAPAGSPEGGQFVAAGGGGGAGTGAGKSKKSHVEETLKEMFKKGTTASEMMSVLGWKAVSMPAVAKSMGLKLIKTKQQGGKTVYTAEPMTAEEILEQHKADKQAKQAKAAQAQPAPAPPKPAPPPPPPPPQPKPAVTLAPAEKQKAAKPTSIPSHSFPHAQSSVKAFNDKWGGKAIPLDDDAKLAEKIADYKAVVGINKTAEEAAAAKQAQAQAEAKAKQAAAAKEAAEKLKTEKAAAAEKNKAVMKELGISETEATGFDALVGMLSEHGGVTSSHDLVEKFKNYAKQAASHSYPISGFEYALIRSYIDGAYHQVNDALRSGTVSAKLHVYTRLVNNALDKLPKYSGTSERGTTLTPSQIAAYKPGHVIEERAFTSTGKGVSFSGNVHYKIKGSGKRGADLSSGANMSEKEVLYKAHTFFLVHKVEQKGGTTHIEMEEVEHHG